MYYIYTHLVYYQTKKIITRLLYQIYIPERKYFKNIYYHKSNIMFIYFIHKQK